MEPRRHRDSSIGCRALLAVLVPVLAGCPVTSAGSDPVPFRYLKTTAPRADPTYGKDRYAGPNVRDCTADDVVVTVRAEDPSANLSPSAPPASPGEDTAIDLTLRLAGDEPCGFHPYTGLSLNADGMSRRVPIRPSYNRRTLLWDGASIRSGVAWINECEPDMMAGAFVRIEFVYGSAIDTERYRSPGCDPDLSNRPVASSSWRYGPPPPPSDPTDALKVELRDVPDTAEAGRPLEFVVKLHNLTAVSIQLDPCPIYEMSLGESGTAVSLTSYVNCSAAPEVIAPGRSLSLEMELPVPERFFGDGLRSALGWQIADDDQESPGDDVYWVDVEPTR